MQELFSNLKVFYEKFLQRGLSYGLSHQQIHESSLNLFIRFLGLFFFAPWEKMNNNNSKMFSYPRKVRMFIHKLLFQGDPENIPLILSKIFSNVTHIENQLKDALTSDEWDELIDLLLSQKWTVNEDFNDITSEENTISPEFLSYFYEAVLNEYEKFFSLKSTPKLSKRKHKGIFFTPWLIIKEITDSCLDRFESQNPELFNNSGLTIRILDPSCGTGSFLLYAAESLFTRLKNKNNYNSRLAQNIAENCIYGVDLSHSSLTAARIRILCWIITKNNYDIVNLPNWLFSNIKHGNSLFGMCKEKIQYPLDYSLVLTRIMNYLRFDERDKSQATATKEKNWLNISLELKKGKKILGHSYSENKSHQNAEEELHHLVNTFYSNWLKRKLKNYNKTKTIKVADIYKITPFHWGIAFPEVILDGGFDIIVGNPPYGRSVLSRIEKSITKLIYYSCSGPAKKYSLNAASAFIERSTILLKLNGIMGMIVPYSILRVEEFESLRDFLLKKSKIWRIHDESSAFSDVTLEMCSIFLIKLQDSDYGISISPRPNIQADSSVPVNIFRKYKRFMIYYDKLWDKVTKQGRLGIVKGDYGIDHRIVGKDLSPKYTSKYRIPFLHSGRSVSKYGLNPKYFQWSKAHPNNKRFSTYFHEPRLINTAIGNRLRVAYKPEKIIPGTNVSILEIPSSYHFYPMLILLNSDLINYLLKRYILNFSHLTVYLHKYYTNIIPIKYPKEYEKEFTLLASYLIFLNQSSLIQMYEYDKRIDYLNNLANYLVYDLYFPEILNISTTFTSIISKFLVPIELDAFLDLIFEKDLEISDSKRLHRIANANKKIIYRVTNRLRDNEEVRYHKKSIYQNSLVTQIRKEL
ncbi:MAG: Eco57I restriction-modification methylase domain-containing protein [Candidatus Hodarchaeota archaeon]